MYVHVDVDVPYRYLIGFFTIVFFFYRADDLASDLVLNGFPVQSIHGDR